MRVIALRAFASAAAVAALAALAPPVARAQAAPAGLAAPLPCRDSTCRVVFDWGSGQTASSIAQDRRYGSGDDFESKLRFVLAGRGWRMTDENRSGELVITLRPRMKKAMCDAMPGTNTDMSCNTVGDVAISFTGGDATLKPPSGRTIRNSCGDATMLATMAQFGQYSGELIAFFVEGEKKGDRRPQMKC